MVLAEGTYDLSTAADYGTGWTDCYRWSDVFDGYALELMNVENFHLKGAGQGKTVLTAVPRYADVLVFTGCSDISVQGITAGHTVEPGYCTGGVLRFVNCAGGIIDSCGLYGCGILGVMADGSRDFRITNTEIYDCTYGAVQLMDCTGFAFDDCSIHDCPMPYFTLLGSQEITLNGEPIY